MCAFPPLWVHSRRFSPQGKRYNYHLTCSKNIKSGTSSKIRGISGGGSPALGIKNDDNYVSIRRIVKKYYLPQLRLKNGTV